jgi:hypothetical protein
VSSSNSSIWYQTRYVYVQFKIWPTSTVTLVMTYFWYLNLIMLSYASPNIFLTWPSSNSSTWHQTQHIYVHFKTFATRPTLARPSDPIRQKSAWPRPLSETAHLRPPLRQASRPYPEVHGFLITQANYHTQLVKQV